MLWYAPHYSGWNFKQTYRRRLLKNNIKTKKLALKVQKSQTLNLPHILTYIPFHWNVVVLTANQTYKHTLLYLYSDLYYFKVLLPSYSYSWFFDPYSRVLNYKSFFQPDSYSFYYTLLNQLGQSFLHPFFNKLKIKGKGYYIYKNYRNTITHQLGHSHRTYIYSYFLTVRFLSKTTVFLFGLSKKDVFLVSSCVRASKNINIFTGRGVRFSRQVIYKKTGKVSSYR